MAKSADLEILEVYFWDESSESVRNLVLVIGGWLGLLAAIIGFVLSGFRTAASNTQAEAALRQNETALRQAELSFESHVTERFTRAVEQLGHEKRAVRLGAIYALERIAKDSPRDRDTIVETLAAYIRELAPWRPVDGGNLRRDDAALKILYESVGYPLPIDIAAAVNIICRLLSTVDPQRKNIDLSYTDLRQLNAPNIDLSHIKLHRANLCGGVLSNATMHGTNLTEANLFGVNLFRANVTDAQLNGSDIRGAILLEVQGMTQSQLNSVKRR